MKNVLLVIALMIFSSQLFAQKKANENAVTTTFSARTGYPPHGYPCLGCHPCGTSYCDDNTNNAKISSSPISNSTVVFKAHPQALELGYVFADHKMMPIKEFLDRKDVKLKLKGVGEITIYDDSTPSTQRTKVKCDCGTNVYGKDAAACGRICDFLGDAGGGY
jgi:hypothetical protein